MSLFKYLKEISIYLILIFIILVIINLNIILDTNIDISIYSLLYINGLILISTVITLTIGYYRHRKRYNEIFNYINNQFKRENTLFDNDIYKIIDDKIEEYEQVIYGLRYELEEIKDYMTNWIHDIKIPISVLEIILQRVKEIESKSNLLSENNLSKEMNIEIKRIENLVTQALYISRSGNYNSDFLVEEINIEKIVKEIIKKNKHLFIYNKIELELNDLNHFVLTDKKWVSHIIEQIIDNSCKYTEKNGKIKIFTTKDEKSIKLHIKDNGIGIVPQDIERVFDKGFTGENGRKRTKSTGMGLYISKKILNRLSHDIDVVSKQNEFCDIFITFYNLSDYFNVT